MREIEQEAPLAMKLLRYIIIRTIVFFDKQGIPEDLLEAVAGDDFDKFDISHAVGRLIAFSFLQR